VTAELVQQDLQRGLPEFDPVSFEVDVELAEGPLRAVAWTYVGRPRQGHHFLGSQLKEDFTLRGVTLIRQDPAGGVSLRWYIDWLDALNRAGLNAAFRPVPDIGPGGLEELQKLIPG
jgi:hypothetical protein